MTPYEKREISFTYTASALKKFTCEEKGGVYVGLWAQATSPHNAVPLSQLTFLQWNHTALS
jgi:hypothetical protein